MTATAMRRCKIQSITTSPFGLGCDRGGSVTLVDEGGERLTISLDHGECAKWVRWFNERTTLALSIAEWEPPKKTIESVLLGIDANRRLHRLTWFRKVYGPTNTACGLQGCPMVEVFDGDPNLARVGAVRCWECFP